MASKAELAILGAGNIGRAMAVGLAARKRFKPKQIILTRRKADHLADLAKQGFQTTSDNLEAIDALEEIEAREKVQLVLMGGFRDGIDAVKALCLGADAAAFGTATIIAGGCIACMQCHVGQCVTGIATQDPNHEKRYQPEVEAQNIHRFFESVRWQIAALTHALGYDDVRSLSRDDLVALTPEAAEINIAGMNRTSSGRPCRRGSKTNRKANVMATPAKANA